MSEIDQKAPPLEETTSHGEGQPRRNGFMARILAAAGLVAALVFAGNAPRVEQSSPRQERDPSHERAGSSDTLILMNVLYQDKPYQIALPPDKLEVLAKIFNDDVSGSGWQVDTQALASLSTPMNKVTLQHGGEMLTLYAPPELVPAVGGLMDAETSGTVWKMEPKGDEQQQ